MYLARSVHIDTDMCVCIPAWPLFACIHHYDDKCYVSICYDAVRIE